MLIIVLVICWKFLAYYCIILGILMEIFWNLFGNCLKISWKLFWIFFKILNIFWRFCEYWFKFWKIVWIFFEMLATTLLLPHFFHVDSCYPKCYPNCYPNFYTLPVLPVLSQFLQVTRVTRNLTDVLKTCLLNSFLYHLMFCFDAISIESADIFMHCLSTEERYIYI